jgi:prepilin-type N-terminal cleavage/methylation domain-containing protein
MLSRRRAFTLIEMLVVIGIIAILAGIGLPAISAVRTRSQVSATEAFLDQLGLAIAQYKSDFGDYPPSRLSRLGLGKGNGANEGIECLVRCVTTTAKSGPYIEFAAERLGNTDSDKLSALGVDNPDLVEIVDPWGNPLAYVHNADYDRGSTVKLAVGGTETVAAAKGDTGQFEGLTTYQLWSAGPDGEVDTDDDLRSRGE